MFVIIYYVRMGSHPRCHLHQPGMLPFTSRAAADADFAQFKEQHPGMLSYEIHELTKVFEFKTPEAEYLSG